MQLRKTIRNFQDVEYNFKLIDRLLKGHMLDGDYIRELPALKITGRLEAHQVTIGHESMFEKGMTQTLCRTSWFRDRKTKRLTW